MCLYVPVPLLSTLHGLAMLAATDFYYLLSSTPHLHELLVMTVVILTIHARQLTSMLGQSFMSKYEAVGIEPFLPLGCRRQ